MKFNEAIASHSHIGFMGVNVMPSIKLQLQGIETQFKSFDVALDTLKGDYSSQGMSFQYLGGADPKTGIKSEPGLLSDHILSKHNTTN